MKDYKAAQESWWLTRVCPVISKDKKVMCVGSSCTFWCQTGFRTSYSGDKVRMGVCTYGSH